MGQHRGIPTATEAHVTPKKKHALTAENMGTSRKLVGTKSQTKKTTENWDHSHVSHAKTQTTRGKIVHVANPKTKIQMTGREDCALTGSSERDTNAADRKTSRNSGKGSRYTTNGNKTGKVTITVPSGTTTAQDIGATQNK